MATPSRLACDYPLRCIYYGRYDETDFEDMVTTLRGIGAWMVDASPGYVSPF